MAEAFGPDGCVVTVGTFDGLHRGHAALLDALRTAGTRMRLPAVVVTFDPHPLQVLRPEQAPRLLTTRAEKLELLAQLGADGVALLAFNRELADMPPERFVRDILLARLGARFLVTGYDHGFGRDRSGDADTLRRIGAEAGFGVQVVAPVIEDGAPVSSSRIRRALGEGNVREAAASLGRAYGMRGWVTRGDGRGRALGFPTANLVAEDPSKLLPLEGIYAVRADVDGAVHDGVMHLGPRPTYPGASETIEVHLFDFSGDLYGRSLGVLWCERIRAVEKYADEATLVRAMEADCRAARRVLQAGGGACLEASAPLS